MTRPENVRCDTCVFWDSSTPNELEGYGTCNSFPTTLPKTAKGFCGQWRDTWPEQEEKDPC